MIPVERVYESFKVLQLNSNIWAQLIGNYSNWESVPVLCELWTIKYILQGISNRLIKRCLMSQLECSCREIRLSSIHPKEFHLLNISPKLRDGSLKEKWFSYGKKTEIKLSVGTLRVPPGLLVLETYLVPSDNIQIHQPCGEGNQSCIESLELFRGIFTNQGCAGGWGY